MKDPILLGFPEAFETERLFVRAPKAGDGRGLNTAVIESLDRLRPWMAWADHAPTQEESEANVRKANIRFLDRTDLRFSLYLKSGAFVGSSGLHRIDWSVPKFEIGYWIRTGYEGQGLVGEAVSGLTGFAFDSLKAQRLEIRTDPLNRRSIRVAERCGYTLEARLKNNSRSVTGELRDTVIYTRLD